MPDSRNKLNSSFLLRRNLAYNVERAVEFDQSF